MRQTWIRCWTLALMAYGVSGCGAVPLPNPVGLDVESLPQDLERERLVGSRGHALISAFLCDHERPKTLETHHLESARHLNALTDRCRRLLINLEQAGDETFADLEKKLHDAVQEKQRLQRAIALDDIVLTDVEELIPLYLLQDAYKYYHRTVLMLRVGGMMHYSQECGFEHVMGCLEIGWDPRQTGWDIAPHGARQKNLDDAGYGQALERLQGALATLRDTHPQLYQQVEAYSYDPA